MAKEAKGPAKGMGRRQFLTVAGAAALGTVSYVVGSLQKAAGEEVPTTTPQKYGMVIDLERCFGCRACMEACKVENNTAQGVFWMYVFRFEAGEYPNTRVSFMPRPCMHCDNAPCVKVCPVGARYKREDGFVLTDYERCIGCRYCEVACPYGVNSFNWKLPADRYYYDFAGDEGKDIYGSGAVGAYTGGAIPPYKNPHFEEKYGKERRLTAGGGHFVGVMEKCTFCVHRVEKGLPPACVANCPVHALHFGDLGDRGSEVSQILASRSSFRLLEELATEPRVYYVGTPPGEEARPIDVVEVKATKELR